MCSMSVLCPLCSHTSFESIDALRVSLIKAANGPLACPICHEAFLGLDKLTIHLFSHSNLMSAATTTAPTTTAAASPSNGAARERKKKSKPQQQNEPKDPVQAEFKGPDASDSTPPLACDLCEFTFSSMQLRDMHFRLVHQPPQVATADGLSHAELNSDAAAKNVNSFKCHLCPKSFKSMGSLRVHMKVVHTSGLSGGGGAEAGNARKFTLVERMRKEGKGMATALKSNRGQMQQQVREDQQMQQFQQQMQQQLESQQQLQTKQLQPQQHQLQTQQLQSQQQQIQSQQQQPQHQLQAVQQLQTLQQLQTQQQQLQHQLVLSPATSMSSNPSTSASTFSIGSITLLQGSGDLLPGDGSAGNVLLLINTAPPLPPLAATTDNEATTEANTASLATPKVLADNPKIWECDVCSKAFTTKYFLKKHKRLHTGEMPYTCEICSRTFTFQQSYHKHLLYHSDEKPHACTVCSRAFKELSTLQNHLRIHSGEKPFKCEVCGKCFRQRVSFLVHTRIHTGVMPYKCDVCDKSFRYKISQRNHKCVPKVAGEEAAPLDAKDEMMTENLLKAFLDQTSAQGSPSSEEIAAINASAMTATATKNQLSDEAMLSKAIDDIVVESCNKLGISSRDTMPLMPSPLEAGSETDDQQQQHLSPVAYDCNEGSNSPSQKFQNMRLYSPQLLGAGELDTLGGFPRFLLDDV